MENDQLLLGLAARDRAASKHAQEIEALIPLAVELAQKAGEPGVTVADLRLLADQRGLLPESKGRRLSYLGVVLERAGLHPAGYRRSHLPKSHGNIHVRWVLPEYAP